MSKRRQYVLEKTTETGYRKFFLKGRKIYLFGKVTAFDFLLFDAPKVTRLGSGQKDIST